MSRAAALSGPRAETGSRRTPSEKEPRRRCAASATCGGSMRGRPVSVNATEPAAFHTGYQRDREPELPFSAGRAPMRHFSTEQAAMKIRYLTVRERRPNRSNPPGGSTPGRASSTPWRSPTATASTSISRCYLHKESDRPGGSPEWALWEDLKGSSARPRAGGSGDRWSEQQAGPGRHGVGPLGIRPHGLVTGSGG
jgi:hypothetical protein